MIYRARTFCPQCPAEAELFVRSARGTPPSGLTCDNRDEKVPLFIRSILSYPDFKGEVEISGEDLTAPPMLELSGS